MAWKLVHDAALGVCQGALHGRHDDLVRAEVITILIAEPPDYDPRQELANLSKPLMKQLDGRNNQEHLPPLTRSVGNSGESEAGLTRAGHCFDDSSVVVAAPRLECIFLPGKETQLRIFQRVRRQSCCFLGRWRARRESSDCLRHQARA